MKKNVKIILIVVGLILTAVASIVLNIYMLQPDNTPEEKHDTVKEGEINDSLDKIDSLTEEEKENLNNKEKEEIVLGEEFGEHDGKLILGKSSSKEYPETHSKALYDELIVLAETANYPDITNKVEELLNKYKFTANYNTKISRVYLDSKIMISVKTNKDLKLKQRGEMVRGLKDPNMLLIGTLMLNERERREIITEIGSLSPIFNGQVNITESKVYTDKNVDENEQAKIIYENENSIKELYEIKFKVEGNPLIGYVVKYANSSLSFHSIISDGEYEHPYKSISYWIGLDPILYPDK